MLNPPNHLEYISIFYLPLFNSEAKKNLFLGRNIIVGAYIPLIIGGAYVPLAPPKLRLCLGLVAGSGKHDE